MPLYDTKCNDCGLEEERLARYKAVEGNELRCSSCGGTVKILVRPSKFIPFQARWFEHFGPDPIYVESKKQLKALCKEHDVTSVYLADS